MKQNSRAASPAAADESLTFEESLHLHEALAGTPAVRTEKMARARALVADPNYPSKAQMKQVANVLAAHWGNSNSAGSTSPRLSGQSRSQNQGVAMTQALTQSASGQRN